MAAAGSTSTTGTSKVHVFKTLCIVSRILFTHSNSLTSNECGIFPTNSSCNDSSCDWFLWRWITSSLQHECSGAYGSSHSHRIPSLVLVWKASQRCVTPLPLKYWWNTLLLVASNPYSSLLWMPLLYLTRCNFLSSFCMSYSSSVGALFMLTDSP